MSDVKAVFVRFGLSDATAESVSNNKTLSATLLASFESARPGLVGAEDDLKKLGPLLYLVATTWPKEGSAQSRTIIEAMIASGQLDTSARVKEVCTLFFLSHFSGVLKSFSRRCRLLGKPGTVRYQRRSCVRDAVSVLCKGRK